MDSALSANGANTKAVPEAPETGADGEVKPVRDEAKGPEEDVRNAITLFFPQYIPQAGAASVNDAGQTESAPADAGVLQAEIDGQADQASESAPEATASASGYRETVVKPADNRAAVAEDIIELDDIVQDEVEVKASEAHGKGIKKDAVDEKDGLTTVPGEPIELEPITDEKGAETAKADTEVKTAAAVVPAAIGAEGGSNNTGGDAKHKDNGQNCLKAAQGPVPAVQLRVEQVTPEKADAKVSYPDIYEKLSSGVKMSIAREGGSVRMSLHPEHLGEMRITLSIEDKSVKAEVLVENNAVKEILSTDTGRLKEIFSQNGLTLEQFSIGLNTPSERDGYQGAGGGFGGSNNNFRDNGRAGDEAETAPYQKAVNRTGIDIFI
ncbi:MAG: flagellar hook-length control protein FliK [Deltaproteobacteria bacterium]|nr:flagellar hook-length control protein FliK [Deltaproteobacteria bacterium]